MKTEEEKAAVQVDEALATKKLEISARQRLNWIRLRSTTGVIMAWLVTVGNRAFTGVTWQEWSGLVGGIVLVNCNDILNYTSVSWNNAKQAVKDLIVGPKPPAPEVNIENAASVTVENKK